MAAHRKAKGLVNNLSPPSSVDAAAVTRKDRWMRAATSSAGPCRAGNRRGKAVAAVSAGLGLLAVAATLWIVATTGDRTGGEPGELAVPTADRSLRTGARTEPGVATSAPPTTPSATPGPARTPPRASGTGAIPNGWPTPQSTGWRRTGVTLRPYGGSVEEIVIRNSGTVIDSADIRARVRIAANDVTIKRSRIMPSKCDSPDGCYVLSIDPGFAGLVVEDTEVTRAAGAEGMDRAVVLADGGGSRSRPRAIVRRAYIHDTYRGIYVGDNTIVEDSYIDDIDRDPPAGAHTAAITAHGGRGITIRHNTIGLPPSEGNSSNISFYGDDRPLEDILIEGNLLNGGGSCLWLTTDFSRASATFVTIRNNLFGVKYHAKCGAYDPAYIVPRDAGGSGFTWSNNVWYAPGNSRNGTPVRFESSS